MVTETQYMMSNADLERTGDVVKTIILAALVRDGKLAEDEADEWAKIHTILRKKKGVFRTISDRWRNEPEDDGHIYWSVVRKV